VSALARRALAVIERREAHGIRCLNQGSEQQRASHVRALVGKRAAEGVASNTIRNTLIPLKALFTHGVLLAQG
jgi:hypothetical protein